MTAQLIDGKALGATIERSLKADAEEIGGRRGAPHLVVIIVGDDAASHVYVRNKQRACERIGIKSTRYDLPRSCDPEGLMELIERLNEDEEVDGILVQSPLPPGFDEVMVTEAIDPRKDVDGFHPVNLGRIVTGKLDGLLPCTPSAVIRMLESTGEVLSGKRALVVGRSRIVGMPAALLLAQRGVDATVTISHSKSQDLRRLCLESDIIVAAVGRPGMIEADWVAPGAIVIDVGINRIIVDGAGKLVGDVEEGAFERASWMTPVPGGVGPMTIAMLMSNTIRAASMRL